MTTAGLAHAMGNRVETNRKASRRANATIRTDVSGVISEGRRR